MAKMIFINLPVGDRPRYTTDRAVNASGQADPSQPQDHGFLYGRSFADPDDHIWEMWTDVEAAMAAQGAGKVG